MNPFDLLQSIFTDYTIRTVALGTLTLGVVSGALGTFAVLRKQALMGDAMSHAALPGVVLAFMLTGQKSPAVLTLGAALAGLAGVLLIVVITRYTRVKQDSSLGIILSVFFGFGLMLLTFLQRNPDARQAGLNSFLFGQAATLLTRDVVVMALFGGAALLLMLLFWKEFKLLSFDRDYGASLGFPMQYLELLITSLLVVAIAIGLQAVGVVLMSAMVVAPAAAARQWTNRLGIMVVLAALFGAMAGVGGTLLSSMGAGLSTGPVIVLAVSVITAVSLLFAPSRGLVWRWVQQQRNRRRLRTDQVLGNLYTLAGQHDDLDHPHTEEALRIMGEGARGVSASLAALAERGLVRRVDATHWALTPAGVTLARQKFDMADDGVVGNGAAGAEAGTHTEAVQP
ncbi:MAG: metal ABC transporter permease [Caldilineaceae bacterium]|nr:metal ABC transporter permease [Caldilineaceae bacterium]